MPDHREFKLGKRPPKRDRRTLSIEKYLRKEDLNLPSRLDRTSLVRRWPSMLNKQIGDCTVAAAGHMIQAWTAVRGRAVILRDSEILDAYSALTGFDPAKPKIDRGATALELLRFWRKRGIGGHKIDAYAELALKDLFQMKATVFLFGGCYIGLELPEIAFEDAKEGRDWRVSPGGAVGKGAPNSWGLHAVPVVGYDRDSLNVVTWGMLKRMTWHFWETYGDEAYAVLSPDWIGAGGEAPIGVDLEGLKKDLREIAAR